MKKWKAQNCALFMARKGARTKSDFKIAQNPMPNVDVIRTL